MLIREQLPENASEKARYRTYLNPDLLGIFKTNNTSIIHATRYQSSWAWMKQDTKAGGFRVGYVDPDYLEMFTLPMLAGDKKTALSEPNGIILAVDLVNFFFGEQNGDYSNVLGKMVTLPASKQKEFIVRGVMENVPDNSVFGFYALTPYETCHGMGQSDNQYGSSLIFVEVDSPKSVSMVEHNMSATFMSFYEEEIEEGIVRGQLSDSDHCVGAYLQPLGDVYFNTETYSDYIRNGNIWYSIILAVIASLILTIACINAITIQLGQVTMRSREVGIRKVVGARQSQLVWQFFTEAGLLCAVAVILAIVMAELFLPAFSNLAKKQLELSFANSAQTTLFLLVSMVIITLVIGGFPSLIMSRFSPLTVMKFRKPTPGRTLFSNGLVVVQYSITIILFFSTFVMQRQIRYLRDKDTGFEREGVMVLSLPTELSNERRQAIKNRLELIPSVLKVAGSDRSFTSGMSMTQVKAPNGEHIRTRILRVDENYLDTLEIPLIEGNGFTADMISSREDMVLINRTMVERFGWDQPIGQIINFRGDPVRIMGVVDDFHIDSMRDELSPLILHMWTTNNGLNYYFIRYRSGSAKVCRTTVEKIWEEFEPNRPIGMRYLDSMLQEQYEDEEQWNRITVYASTIAILLSCMGLWGITALAVSRRTKEIGIRKVLGSGEAGIWSLFLKDLLRLFAVSFVIAVPAASYAMQKWLDLFAYHISVPWQAFAQAALTCLMLAALTISWLVIRAAGNNPVESLRYE